MASVVLSISDFRAAYPAFSDVVKYPDATITGAFNKAQIFVKNETNCALDEDRLETILYLMTAHLLQTQTNAVGGSTAGVIASASMGGVSVSIASPKNADEFQYFLNQSPYGQELLALFSILAMGGFYFGGNGETLAFR